MIILIFFTAFLMEAIGSYVSVVGLGSLFSGDIVILIMAVVLDVAKIVSVSFLYQYWYNIKLIMKSYLLAAVMVLMTITSVGSFGYLSGSFQRAVQPNLEIMLKANSLKQERESLINERTQLLEQRLMIDKQIAQLSSENVNGRRALMRSFKPESTRISNRITDVTKRIDVLNQDILVVQSQNIEKQVHIGPISYVAKAFNLTMEEASKWIILTIIFVFDPLAVVLIIAGNFLIKYKKDQLTVNIKTDEYETKSTEDNKHEYQQQVSECQQSSNRTNNKEPIDMDALVQPVNDKSNMVVQSVSIAQPINSLNNVYIHDDHNEEPEIDYQEDELYEEQDIRDEWDDIDITTNDQHVYPKSVLEDLNINYRGALIREGVVTHSTKRHLYTASE